MPHNKFVQIKGHYVIYMSEKTLEIWDSFFL